jgi:hypothetical protein
LASSRLSPLLALEIASTGATADRGGIARADPADAQGEFALRAPRIHGELLKLGFELAQSSVAHCASFTLAEWFCRTADRIDPA